MTSIALTLAGVILLAGAMKARADDSFIAVGQNLGDRELVLIEQFKEKLEHLTGTRLALISSIEDANLHDESATVITLGADSLRDVLSGEGKSSVIATFISSEAFSKLVSEYPTRTHRALKVVLSDPDPVKQIALAKVLYGSNLGVAFFTSSLDSQLAKEYQDAGKRLGISVKRIVIDENYLAKRTFDSIDSERVIVLAKERALFEEVNLERLLYIAYDIYNIGIIGYSSGLVRNGAVGTTYASLDNIVLTISEIIKEKGKERSGKGSKYSSSFSVKLNKFVMRSLLVPEIDEKQAAERVKELIEEAGL